MDITWIYAIKCNLSMFNNGVRNKIFFEIPVLLLILAISIPMVTAPVSSNNLFSYSSIQVNQLAYAEEEGNDSGGGDSNSGGGDSNSGGGDSNSGGGDSNSGGGESNSGGGDSNSGGGDSNSGDQSTSSTTTDPTLASSTTTDPTLASSTTTDPTLASSTTTDPTLASSTTTDPTLASSTTTDPTLASSTTTDPTLASSTTTDPTLRQDLLDLTSTTEKTSPSVVEETDEQDLNCKDIPEKNFKVSSKDPDGFDGDNDGIGCES